MSVLIHTEPAKPVADPIKSIDLQSLDCNLLVVTREVDPARLPGLRPDAEYVFLIPANNPNSGVHVHHSDLIPFAEALTALANQIKDEA